jgi:DNA mismatch endonuclease, patch repair protein
MPFRGGARLGTLSAVATHEAQSDASASAGSARAGSAKEGAAARPYPRPLNAGRSANMKANRRRDTKPELALRAALHARGYRYRKDFRLDLPLRRVRPDIAFTSRKVAVFVDGCFWHACPEHGSQPKNNDWYWSPKLAKNVERDRAADEALTQAGWTVVRLWEHLPLPDAVEVVIAAVGNPRAGDPAAATINPHAGLPGLHIAGAGRRPRHGRGGAGAAARVRGHPGAP